MSHVIALLHPSGLLGSELRQALGRRRELWQEVLLFTTDADEAGTLTDVGGAAAMVNALEDGDLERVDVAFFCGTADQSRPLYDQLGPAATRVVLSPDAGPDDGHPVVSGVNLATAVRTEALVSPHAGAVLLAHLVHALRDFGPRRVDATLLEPVSVQDKAGLDEVFEQTRALLRFDANPPRRVFPVQMAFNVIPAAPVPHLVAHLETVLDGGPEVAVQVLRAGVFHGFGASVTIVLEDDPGAAAVRDALGDHPLVDLAVDPELLGMIDAAGREEVLVGPVERLPRIDGAYGLWAVMDNLVCGGASNALAILEAITTS